MENKNKRMLKIIVPIVILVIIIGIGVLKNKDKSDIHNEVPINNPDFVLETTHLDLEQLKSYGLPIMLDFGSDGCEPCKAMAPALKELNEEYQGKVIIKFMDVWKDQTLGKDFPLEVIPTQFFFDKNGEPYVPSDSESMIMYTLKTTNEHIYTAHQGGMTKEMITSIFKELGVE